VDPVALSGEGEGEAQEQRRLPLVVPGGAGERVERVLTVDDLDQGVDGGRQPVARHVRDTGLRLRGGAIGDQVDEELLRVAVKLRRVDEP